MMMNHMYVSETASVIVSGLWVILISLLSLFFFGRRFLGIGWGVFLWLGAWLCAAVVMVCRLKLVSQLTESTPWQATDPKFLLSGVCAGLLVVFAVPFVVRLYNKWTGKSIDECEKASGTEGVRAWLSGWNLVLAVAIAMCAWQGFEYSFWGVLAMTLGLLLAYPAMRELSTVGRLPQTPTTVAADLSDERERVLRLLENGKITAEEGAELLNALGGTICSETAAPTAMTVGRELLLLGSLLVIVAFFLPWYSIDLGQEANRAMQELSQFGDEMSRSMGAPQMVRETATKQWEGMPQQANVSRTIHIAGGDVAKGFGWIILVLGVLAAAMPFVKLDLSRQAQKIVLITPLAVGAFLIIYLLTHDISYVSVGLPLAMAGYCVELVGLMKEIRGCSPNPCPSLHR